MRPRLASSSLVTGRGWDAWYMARAVTSPTVSSLTTPSPSPSTPSPTISTPCMPTSLVAAPRTKSRMNFFEPFHWKGLTIRSLSMPSIAEVSTVPSQLTVIEPKLVPLAARAVVTGAPEVQAACWAPSRMPFSLAVISSASRCTAPRPNTCGALRLIHSAGFPVRPGSRITLLPVSPAPSPPPRL